MIEIDETIPVKATPDQVWSVLSDPYEVVACIPKAEITSENDDGSYDGRVTIGFGPMRIKFMARVALDLDEANRSGTITGRGKDDKGGTRMSATAGFDLDPKQGDGPTTVKLAGNVELSGRLASQIEAAAGVVVRKMTNDFTEALEERLSRAGAEGRHGDGAPGPG